MADDARTLTGISALRGFFRTNRCPIYFVSPVAFNLLGIDRWVRRFEYGLDSKIVTTELGDEAGVPSVPNVLAHASTYDELTTLAQGAGLGTDLVVQTPYGVCSTASTTQGLRRR